MRLLCLPCIFQKSFDVLFKRLFVCFRIVYRNLFTVDVRRAYRWRILIIVFVVLLPCSVEAFSHTGKQVAFEVINSHFDSRVFFFQDWNNVSGRSWPLGWSRIKPFEFCMNNISKLLGGIKITPDGIPTQTKETTNKSSKGREIPSGKSVEIFYHCILGVILVLPFFDVPFPIVVFLILIWFRIFFISLLLKT